MTWFIGIFTDILGTCGIVLGGIIVAILALLVVAFYIVLGMFACGVAVILVYMVLYYWPRVIFFKIRGKDVPPEQLMIWTAKQSHKVKAWMDNVSVWLDKKHEQVKAKAEAQKWKR